MADEVQRATVRLTTECNNRCVFCAQTGIASHTLSLVQVEHALRNALEHSREVTFVGGEPTIFSNISDAIQLAKSLGFERVGIQTNARALRNSTESERITKAGLTDVHVSIHGADAATHDYHTGQPGSFDESLSGLAAMRSRGVTAVATTVLTRSNFRSLTGIPALLSARGLAGWLIAIPHSAGHAALDFDRVIPRLAMALPFALHALDSARTLGLPAWIQGAPLCLLGPFAMRALSEPPRAFAQQCGSCAAKSRCSGLDAEYLARFVGDEISARRAPKELPAKDNTVITRLFVGAGELIVPSREKKTRVGLPVVG